MRMLVVVGTVSLGVLAGCSTEREWHTPDAYDPFVTEESGADGDWGDDFGDEWDDDYVPPPASFTVKDAHVGGTIGPVRDLDLTIDEPYVYEDASFGYTNVNLSAVRDDGAMGMMFMDLYNVSVGELPEGTTPCGTNEATGAQVNVTGCSSDSSGDNSYDAPANSCEVTVQHTDEGTLVTVSAQLPSSDATGETLATARFLAAPVVRE